MHPETRDTLLLIGKSILFVVGGLLAIAAGVELMVAGASAKALLTLLVGLALLLPPLGFAFRDALREARKGRL